MFYLFLFSLGYGLGTFLGGFGLDKLGARQTFFSASIISFGCLLLFLLASYIFKTSSDKIKSQANPLEMEDVVLKM